MPNDRLMWCIKKADGLLLLAYIEYRRADAIKRCSSAHGVLWQSLYRKGFRAVQVRITEQLHA